MSDYDRIAQAISFITQHANTQPSLNDIAAHLNLSPFHFQRLFSRWAGVTPKRYLQTLTVERAKRLLSESTSVLDASYSLGLSGGSRLYDHFVQLEAVTPGEFKSGGQGLTIEYALHLTVFGYVFIALTPKGVCQLTFLENDDITECLSVLSKKWPNADVCENTKSTAEVVENIFTQHGPVDSSLSLHVSGTNFQINVWKALLQIPSGTVISYKQIADAIGSPRSSRAVGSAVGANPVAFLIPCHRVIRQSGELGGYRWGETRKHAIHAWEAALLDTE